MASWKYEALAAGVCRDVDHDEAEILLLRVKRLEGNLRERQGLYVDDNGVSPIEGVDPAWLAKQLEKDAAEEAKRERQRVKEEGGRWDAVGLKHELSGVDVEEKPERNDDVESEEEVAA